MKTEFALPQFYSREKAGRWDHRPGAQALFDLAPSWAQAQGIKPAGSDRFHVHLLLIDVQKDFCLPEGTLFVAGRSGAGAIDDSRRIAEFIYRNLGFLTNVTTTLDTHFAHQIFFPSFWVDREGKPPSPFRTVTADEVRAGALLPHPAVASWLCGGHYNWLCRQVAHYCEELEKAGKYQLYLWPPHCLIGSRGHTMVGVVQEARLFHAYARQAEASIEIKGTSVLTEHYSVLAPEITTAHDGSPLGEAASDLAERLLAADRLVIAGQASSHCVKNTIEDLARWIAERDRALARRVYVLEDCMSAVAVPDPARPGQFAADFTESARATLDRCREVGMRVVESTVPMNEWPPLDERGA